jgi:uncharacterized PurR-regulated membrane protein YhhQ (DUF165 family)
VKKILLFSAYLSTIPLANWFISNVGTQVADGAPHTIGVGFGFTAPSGVLIIGLALLLRDLLHQNAGKQTVLIAMSIGIALSFLINPAVAVASACAFALSEFSDFAVYVRVRRISADLAMVISGIVGAVIDSFVFLYLAFGSITYWQGQIIGKIEMTLALVLALKVWRAVSQWLSATE